jgi:hypothetical protein
LVWACNTVHRHCITALDTKYTSLVDG